jgi:general secretion pathway protein E
MTPSITASGASLEDRVIARLGISTDAVSRARLRRRDAGRPLCELLAEHGIVDYTSWARAVADEVGLPFLPALDDVDLDPTLVGELPMGFATRHLLVPLRRGDDALDVAIADLTTPEALGVCEDLRLLYGTRIRPLLAPAPAVRDAIARLYDAASAPAADLLEGLSGQSLGRLAAALEEPRDLLDAGDEAPLIRFVNALFAEALAAAASDIHLEPAERGVSVRFRIDGLLYDVLEPPHHLHAALVSRLKVMASLDIAERRLPQDGRIRLRVAGRDVDVRVSIVPTVFGERTVLRLLDRGVPHLVLDRIGLPPDLRGTIEALLERTHGVLLVTGPTGSGKTTTLYAALAHVRDRLGKVKNIMTIEDPVEYRLDGIGQIQVNPKVELSFARGLRATLRQDPDVMMVGEIRDRETAEIAIHAALTGHLVLSTLHTTDAAGALTRLLDMGIEPFLVSSAVTAVLGQRLVRRVCPSCREPAAPSAALRGRVRRASSRPRSIPSAEAALAPDEVATAYQAGPGCPSCRQTGYRGRTGIFELLVVDDPLRRMVLDRTDTASLRRHALARGMTTMHANGIAKVVSGETTIEELARVTRDDS